MELLTVASVPLKVTVLFAAVVSKSDPVMVTVVPTVPLDGEKLERLAPELPQPARIIRGSQTASLAIVCRNRYIEGISYLLFDSLVL